MTDCTTDICESTKIDHVADQISQNQEIQIEEPSIELKLPVNPQFNKQILSLTPLKDSFQKKLLPSTCSIHPNEQLQFYCYNKNITLCAECLVTGKYAGLEISNFKKAIERFQAKVDGQVSETEKKLEVWDLVEKEVSDQGKEFETIISTYETNVKEQIKALRQKLDEKELQLNESLNTIKREIKDEIHSVLSWLQNHKNEMSESRTIKEEEIQDLDELNLCNFYLRKSNFLQTYLDYEVSLKTQEVSSIIQQFQTQFQGSLIHFQEKCKKLEKYIESLEGFQKINVKYEAIPTIKLTPKDSSLEFLKGIQSASSLDQGEQSEAILLHNMDSLHPVPHTKHSYLANGVYGDLNLVDLTTNKSTAEFFEKHIEKLLEIRRKTPSRERKTSERAFSKEGKRTDCLSSFKLELNRGESAAKVLNARSIKDSYHDFLGKSSGTSSKGVLKSFIMTTSPKTSSDAFSWGFSSINNPLDVSGNTKVSNLLEKCNKSISEPNSQATSTRTMSDLNTDKSNRANYSTKNLKRGNEILAVLGGSREFEKKRVQEKKGSLDASLKKTLDKLNNGLFN